ncbi:MAG: exosortase [Phycisphaerales bacterium]|nr:MAG: exosortase [Phycisphaerales bacterium]
MREEYARKPDIRAIILVGSRDFGRCPLAARLPTALWPVGGVLALERLLDHLADEGLRRVAICSSGDGPLLKRSIKVDDRLELEIFDEELPVGTAGSIGVAGDETDALLLVFSGSITCPPKIDTLIEAHREGQSDLTVVFNPGGAGENVFGEPAGIYVCETSILEYIPKEGYFDIKEGLIPKILRVGKTVYPAVLPSRAGNFRDRRGYLSGISDYLENVARDERGLSLYEERRSQTACGDGAQIDPGARVFGPVAVMKGARIARGAVVFGPTVIGRNVIINEDSVVVNSVLWDDSQIGADCELQRCVVDYHAIVRQGTSVEERSIPSAGQGVRAGLVGQGISRVGDMLSRRVQNALRPLIVGIRGRLPNWMQERTRSLLPWFGAGIILAAFIWSYWPGLTELWKIWRRSDEYSSGLLVPFLAVYVLWSRRHEIAKCPMGPSAWGLILFLGAQIFRLLGLYLLYGSAEMLSIVMSVAALVLLLFGWHVFRRVGTVLLFLCLMLPWPHRVQSAVSLPLQSWATSSAIFCLELMGYDVVPGGGNVIHIGDSSVAVAEACNGLRMITAFFVIGALVVLLVKRAWWEKLIVLVSSLPIALLCNTVRLALTAIAFTKLSGEHWEEIFHDFGGYAMMPLALAAVVAELWLLARLTTLPVQEEAIIITRQGD